MQQRQPRLGDILDDYCPRERRITNHAVVAMIDETIKQTRCTTCDAEHDYRHARVPRARKKKDTDGALYQEVLAGMPRKGPVLTGPDEPETPTLPAVPVPEPAREEQPVQMGAAADTEPDREEEEEGPVHRQLIRATLPPRPDGQVPARPAPEFTMRQPIGRPGRFRDGARGPQHRMGNTRGSGFGFRSEGRPQDRHPHGNRSGNHAPGRPARHSGGSGGRPGKKRSR